MLRAVQLRARGLGCACASLQRGRGVSHIHLQGRSRLTKPSGGLGGGSSRSSSGGSGGSSSGSSGSGGGGSGGSSGGSSSGSGGSGGSGGAGSGAGRGAGSAGGSYVTGSQHSGRTEGGFFGDNASLGAGFLAVAIATMGLSYASVPLYRMFCQATGFGGTTKKHEMREEEDGYQLPADPCSLANNRTLKVTFNTDVANDLPWSFRPAQKSVTLLAGQTSLAFFEASLTLPCFLLEISFIRPVSRPFCPCITAIYVLISLLLRRAGDEPFERADHRGCNVQRDAVAGRAVL